MKRLLFPLLIVGCGPPQTDRTRPHLQGDAQAGALPPADRFASPGLPRYADKLRLDPTPAERAARSAIKRAAQPPPALDCYAREHAARFALEGGDPDPAAVDVLVRHCGYWVRPTDVYSVTGPTLAAVTQHLEKLPPEAGQGEVGVGAVNHADGKVTVTLARGDAQVALSPIEPNPSNERPLTLTGRLLRSDGPIELWIDDGKSAPKMLPVPMAPTGQFKIEVPADTQWPARLELTRKLGRFRHLIALIDAPRTPEARPLPASSPTPPDHAAAAQALNAERQRAGRLPLNLTPRLSSRLDQWLGQLVEGSAPSEPPGLLDDRGWPFARVEFAFTSGRDPAQAIKLMTSTPTGHRLALATDVDHVALGVRPFDAKSPELGADYVVVVVRRLAQPTPQIARASVLSTINAERGKQKLGPLASNAGLEGLAQTLAEQSLTGAVDWGQVVAKAMTGIRRGKLASGAVGAGGASVIELQKMDFSQQPIVLSPAAKHVGIGVSSGPLPGGGAPRHIVVFIVASEVPEGS